MGTVVGKITDPQRKFSRGNFNLCESLNKKSDLIHVKVLIPTNIQANFQHHGNRVCHRDDPQEIVEGNSEPTS